MGEKGTGAKANRETTLSCERGTTVAEMIVVAVVFALLFGLVYQSLVPGLRAWQRSDPRARAQQNCLVAVGRITQDIRASCIGTLFIIQGTYIEEETNEALPCDAVTFLRPLDRNGNVTRDSNGRPVWQQFAVYYLDVPSRTLRCHVEPLAAGGEPCLRSFAPDPDRDRVVARSMWSLSVTADRNQEEPDGDSFVNPVTVKVQAREGEFLSELRSSVPALVDLVNPGEVVMP